MLNKKNTSLVYLFNKVLCNSGFNRYFIMVGYCICIYHMFNVYHVFFSYLNKYKCIKYMLKFCYVCVKCMFMSIILSFLKYEAFTVTRMCTKYDFSLKVYLNLFLKP